MKNSLPPSPVKKFTIHGLHGYKDITIDFAGPATVVVAENGTGKTTVLNALNAFLTGRFHRLASIRFDSIECQFAGELAPIVLERSQLGRMPLQIDENPYQRLASMSPVSETELVEFLQSTYVPGNYMKLRTHPVVHRIYMSTHHDHESLEKELNLLHSMLDSSLTEQAKLISFDIRRRMGDIEVIYLPTYRRIERPLLRTKRTPSGYPPGRGNRARHEYYDDMAFGLTDVEERLVELSEEIERRSNFGYRSLSTKILDEMLKGRAKRETAQVGDLPDVDSLFRFLSRVGREDSPLADVYDDIRRLYETGEIEGEENWFLRYFLSRLGEVIDQTRETELKVEQFVDVCNSYLTLSGDEKKLSFDPKTLKVLVQDMWANCAISLDDLSSGEKQIVSLMSRLYLSGKPKFVLMDEPELSLSLDWQRKVLPDVVNSGTVVQMLAITHSPFVFENELDKFARPLKMTRTRVAP
ncbi:AAA family ATPase [Burkholderia arboris]|uniref:AAA family ATPase n=1 Tax=Burkholderia arboris TaxID=488730 RepID=UPI00210BE7F7|nr:AAA family ATPase [Burkholderia arboris]UTV56085.1 AAA family ATPase [Burkholderia arboris]